MITLIDEVSDFIKENYDDLKVDRISDNCLYLEVHSECMGCPYREFTLENEVKEAISRKFPQIKRISITSAVSDEVLDFAKKILGVDKQ